MISLSHCSQWSSSSIKLRPPLSLSAPLPQVDILIPAHPRLRDSDRLQCVFGTFKTEAVMVFNGQGLVTCSLPDPVEIPPTPDPQGKWTRPPAACLSMLMNQLQNRNLSDLKIQLSVFIHHISGVKLI